MFVNLSNSKYYAGIKGIGFYVPERIVTNKELEQYVNTSDEWIQEKIGAVERRIVDESEKTSDLAYRAALAAIQNAGITPEEIDLIILNCLCPDHRDPATSCLVQAKLGAFNAAAFDINVGGCPGAVYSLSVGTNFVVNGGCKNVLVISGDALSTTLINWRDRTTCCFFGDGAGAVVLGRTSKPGIKGYLLNADGRGYEAIMAPFGWTKNFPEGKSINNTEGLPLVRMDGKAVWNFATRAFPESVRQVANGIGMDLNEIDLVIPHQANANIIKEGMEMLGLPYEKAFVNIHRYANTGGASVYIALAEAVQEGKITQGSRLVISSFGAGLAWGAVILEWSKKEDFKKEENPNMGMGDGLWI